IATDNVGHREATPEVAQATIIVGTQILATGADAGGAPEVKVFDAAQGGFKYSFLAYDSSFTGGVRVAGGDINRDGIPDVITATGPGMAPLVRIWNGVDGSFVREFLAYDSAFTGGIYIATGDIDKDGIADIITGAGAGGGPHVKVFSGADGHRFRNF